MVGCSNSQTAMMSATEIRSPPAMYFTLPPSSHLSYKIGLIIDIYSFEVDA